jgi:hypothetical protein
MKKFIAIVTLSLCYISLCNAGDGEGSGSEQDPITNENQTNNSETQEVCIQTIFGELCFPYQTKTQEVI